MSTLLHIKDIESIHIGKIQRGVEGYCCTLVITDEEGDVVDISLGSEDLTVLLRLSSRGAGLIRGHNTGGLA